MSNIRDFTKRQLQRFAPNVLFAIHAARLRRYFRKEFFQRQQDIKQKLYGNGNPRVLFGPFAGLHYLNEAVWGAIEPKWLGTYEYELHGLVAHIIEKSYDVIIVIGSAEGYYSVGIATKLSAAKVYSYDVDPWARAQQRRLARMNGVGNIWIGRFCETMELERRISERTLVICDAEGYEYNLLDPNRVPALRKCDILTELHFDIERALPVNEASGVFANRFCETHDVTKIRFEGRANVPLGDLGSKLPAEDLARCIDEHRPADQVWLWIETKGQPTIKIPASGG